ncbi:MAG: PTS system mannose/fructose/sorbose family transporter subunit IID [Mycobacterium leprae]
MATNETRHTITRADLRTLFYRSFALQGSFNYERMQGLGFAWALLPLIKKLYSTKEERAAALKRHLAFFNTHPWTAGPIFGMVASMEERMASGDGVVDEEGIQAIKGGLMGPLAGIGDSLFFSTLRPIIAGIAVTLALTGNFLAPLLFVVGLNAIHIWVAWAGLDYGYKLGDRFLEQMESMQIQKVMEGAAIVGLMVLGALVATWLNVQTPMVYTMQKASIPVQKMLDGILPKMLPLAITLLVFRYVRKGKSATIVLLALVLLGLVGGYLNILK